MKAATYYLVTLTFSALVFVVVGSWLNDGVDEAPWLVASICAVGVAAGSVLLKEFYLRPRKVRSIAARKLSNRVMAANGRRRSDGAGKFTLGQNEEFLAEIRKKSEAANVLGKFADPHKEVFELCESYIELTTSELDRVRAGSPRIPAFRKGSKFAAERHRFHMLKWAEISAKSFSEEARTGQTVTEKIGAAENALVAVRKAMGSYPDEPALSDSEALLEAYILTARVGNSIEAAEMEARSGNGRAALDQYRKVLHEVDLFDGDLPERPLIRNRLELEIERLSEHYG